MGKNGKLEVKNNYIIGNILMDNGKANHRAEMNIEAESDLAYNNIADYNIYWRSAEDGRNLQLCTGWGDESFDNLSDWYKTTGYDEHSIFADPKFINIEEMDFHLLPDSPAIGFVKPIISVIDDFNGIKREPYDVRDGGPYSFTGK